jgi:hypothetical protein
LIIDWRKATLSVILVCSNLPLFLCPIVLWLFHSSFSPQMDEKERKKKKKLRFKRRNPFLLPKRKSIPKKKRNKEAEVLIADKEEHFGMEGLGFCRLIVNGEVSLDSTSPSLSAVRKCSFFN